MSKDDADPVRAMLAEEAQAASNKLAQLRERINSGIDDINRRAFDGNIDAFSLDQIRLRNQALEAANKLITAQTKLFTHEFGMKLKEVQSALKPQTPAAAQTLADINFNKERQKQQNAAAARRRQSSLTVV